MKKYLIISLIICLSALAACTTATSNNTEPFVGTWTLTSYTPSGGAAVTGAALATMMTETIVVKGDNTYTGTGTFQSSAPSTFSGTWSKSGSTYTVTASGGSASSGTISGNLFTTDDAASNIYVFTKS